jgi:hypothetical protein
MWWTDHKSLKRYQKNPHENFNDKTMRTEAKKYSVRVKVFCNGEASGRKAIQRFLCSIQYNNRTTFKGKLRNDYKPLR